MATSQVQIGFFETRTQTAGPPLLLELGPFNKRVSFFSPKPSLLGLHGPREPIPATFGPNLWSNPTQSYLKY